MTDAAWNNIGPILVALTSLVGVIFSSVAAMRAGAAKEAAKAVQAETAAQTVIISKAAADASEAASNTDGRLKGVEEKLEKRTDEHIKTLKDQNQQLRDDKENGAAAVVPVIVQQSPVSGPSVAGGRRAEDTKP